MQWWGWERAVPSAWLVVPFEVARAGAVELRLAALGTWVEPWLDGRVATDQRLLPANAPTELGHIVERLPLGHLDAGQHVLGLWTGGGYGSEYCIWGWRWLDRPMVGVELVGADQEQLVLEDCRWSPSAVTSAGIYAGERFDMALDRDWCRVDASWPLAPVLDGPRTPALERITPPIRVVRDWPARLPAEVDGARVFDLGQNIAGHVRIDVSAPAGSEVVVRHAEEVNAVGSLDVRSNRGAAAVDRLVVAGEPDASGMVRCSWEPRFTSHGFRHVSITGASQVHEVVGRETHADLQPRGSFECSDELVNQLWRNNRFGIAGNAMSFPTDTPTRDERTPPALDVHPVFEAALFDFDVDDFYRSYARWSSTWPTQADMGGCAIALPWALFQQDGDVDALREALPGMRAWLNGARERLVDGRWPDGGHEDPHGYGDWAAPIGLEASNFGEGGVEAGDYQVAFNHVGLVNQALLAHLARQFALASDAVGDPGAPQDAAVAEELAAGFHSAFWRGDHYDDGRQVTAVLPLALGLVPDDCREACGESLARAVEAADGHLDVGIFGVRYLLDALAIAGLDHLALPLLHREGYPGFAFQLARGATTPWEQWVVAGPMVSHNHAMFAGMNASFYGVWAGLRRAAPGWTRVAVDPHPPVGLDWLRASVELPTGRLAVDLRREGSGWAGSVELPVAGTIRGIEFEAGTHQVRW